MPGVTAPAWCTYRFWLLAQTVQNLSLNPSRVGSSLAAAPFGPSAGAASCSGLGNDSRGGGDEGGGGGGGVTRRGSNRASRGSDISIEEGRLAS